MGFDIQTWIQFGAYIGAGLAMGFGAIGAAIGEGYTAAQASAAISQKPELSGDIIKTMLIGQAIAESAGIFALVVAIILLFTNFAAGSLVTVAALIGAGLSMGLGAIGSGIGAGFPAGAACTAKAQNPKLSGQLTTNMLIGSAICQTPSIFALIVAIMLLYLPVSSTSLLKAAALLGAGISMGFGAIGSGIGSGLPGEQLLLGIARHPKLSGRLVTTMLIGSAVCQTPAIFAMVVALMLMFIDFGGATLKAAALLGAGISMGFGAIGSGLGSGFPGKEACLGVARQPAAAGQLTTTMLVGSAVCQTPTIFAMVVALILMFWDSGNAPLHPTSAAFLGAGLSTGLAAIGSGYGGGLAAGAGCDGIARQPETGGNVITTMLVGQAVAQTPSIFGLLISFILIFKPFPESITLSASMALLGAGISMGFGGIGPGIGNGMAAESAVRWVARNIEHAGDLMRTMLVGQAVSQSTAIYAMVISLVLIFVV